MLAKFFSFKTFYHYFYRFLSTIFTHNKPLTYTLDIMFGLNSTTVLILNRNRWNFEIFEKLRNKLDKMLPKTSPQNCVKWKKTRPTSKNSRTIPKELQFKSSLRLLLCFRKKYKQK